MNLTGISLRSYQQVILRDKRTARSARLGYAHPLIAGCCVPSNTLAHGGAHAPPIQGVRADCASRETDAPRLPPCEARGSTASVGWCGRWACRVGSESPSTPNASPPRWDRATEVVSVASVVIPQGRVRPKAGLRLRQVQDTLETESTRQRHQRVCLGGGWGHGWRVTSPGSGWPRSAVPCRTPPTNSFQPTGSAALRQRLTLAVGQVNRKS